MYQSTQRHVSEDGNIFINMMVHQKRRDSVVGIATGYGLDSGGAGV
jgi:hypothetical protein